MISASKYLDQHDKMKNLIAHCKDVLHKYKEYDYTEDVDSDSEDKEDQYVQDVNDNPDDIFSVSGTETISIDEDDVVDAPLKFKPVKPVVLGESEYSEFTEPENFFDNFFGQMSPMPPMIDPMTGDYMPIEKQVEKQVEKHVEKQMKSLFVPKYHNVMGNNIGQSGSYTSQPPYQSYNISGNNIGQSGSYTPYTPYTSQPPHQSHNISGNNFDQFGSYTPQPQHGFGGWSQVKGNLNGNPHGYSELTKKMMHEMMTPLKKGKMVKPSIKNVSDGHFGSAVLDSDTDSDSDSSCMKILKKKKVPKKHDPTNTNSIHSSEWHSSTKTIVQNSAIEVDYKIDHKFVKDIKPCDKFIELEHKPNNYKVHSDIASGVPIATQFYYPPVTYLPSHTMKIPIDLGPCLKKEMIINMKKLCAMANVGYLGQTYLSFSEFVDIEKIELLYTDENQQTFIADTIHCSLFEILSMLKITSDTQDISHNNYTLQLPFFRTPTSMLNISTIQSEVKIKVYLKKPYPLIRMKCIFNSAIASAGMSDFIQPKINVIKLGGYYKKLELAYSSNPKTIKMNHNFLKTTHLILKVASDTNTKISLCGTIMQNSQIVAFIDDDINDTILHNYIGNSSKDNIGFSLYVIPFTSHTVHFVGSGSDSFTLDNSPLEMNLMSFSSTNEFYSKIQLEIFAFKECIMETRNMCIVKY